MLHGISNPDIHLLRVFVAVVECGGFSAAQISLNVAQSTISTQMSSLETRLGLRLCNRGRAGFSLTDDGRAVYDAAISLFHSIDQFTGRVNERRGGLRARRAVELSGAEPPSSARVLAPLGLLALWIMIPVTLPVPVLRELVQDRFAVSEILTSLFRSINMVGAQLAAPLAGALADRTRQSRALLVAALVTDAACFAALAAPVPYGLFLLIRFVEGCAHITALSVLLALASAALPPERRGRAMGAVGGSMTFGIALGAPLGGFLGGVDALLPLQVAGALALSGALLAALVLREPTGVARARPGLAEIARALRTHPALLVPLTFAFADRFTVGFFTTTFSLYMHRIHGASPADIGIAIAIFMIPFAVLSYPFGILLLAVKQFVRLTTHC